MIGTTLSHYRVLEEIGAGGMGVVYRARDERLERDVALKVLPPSVCEDEVARARLLREARAASALNHPGICTVYEVAEEGQRLFIAMEWIEGGTLADRVLPGPLPLATVLRLGGEIADALAHAHARDVIHRDLKTANIVLTADGRAKVLDFGLARRMRGAAAGSSGPALTEAGAIVGTPHYLAPEVLRGEPADARSDLWSLGVVLYEIAAGERPFRGATEYEVSAAILNAPPEALPRGIPPALAAVIARCLEKDPGRRYASAREVADDLRGVTRPVTPAPARAAGAPAIGSIAVLPLENLSGDPEQEFFADGMTDALITDLAQIGALRVISRTSAMQYKGIKRPLPEIARELNVDAIVEGSVLRSGGRVRITAQLIDAATERHLWARRYERDVGDVLELQGEVARAIADEVRVKLTPREERRLARQRAVQPEAFEAYMRGRHFWNKRTVPEVRRSIEFFQRAIEADPGYALAYAGLADSWNILGDLRSVAQADAFARGRAAAEQALALDPSLGEPHTSLGFVRMFHDFDWPGAARAFERALTLSPGYATGHQWYAEFLVSQRRFDEAIAEARRAEQLDPLSAVIGETTADVFYFARRYPEAIAQSKKVMELEPTFVLVHPDLGRAYAQIGEFDRAVEHFREAMRLGVPLPGVSAALAYTLAAAGRREEALAMLPELEQRAKGGGLNPYALATVYVGLGERERAMEWLDRACERRDGGLVWVRVHPRLDPLRDHPGFADLLRRMGFQAA